MRYSILTGLVAGAALSVAALPANAQDTTTQYSNQPVTTAPSSYSGEIWQGERPINPPRNAFELNVRGGYNQGAGRFSGNSGGAVTDITNAGGSVEIVPSYRMTPHSSVGVLAQYNQYSSDQQNTTVRGLATGLDYTYHIRPGYRADPWVSAGVGYRFLWVNPGEAPNTLLHGFQLARVTIGLDAAVSDDVALGPYVGADLSMFLWQRTPNGNNEQIPENGRVSTFVSAGIAGRFDIGGTRDRSSSAVYTGKL